MKNEFNMEIIVCLLWFAGLCIIASPNAECIYVNSKLNKRCHCNKEHHRSNLRKLHFLSVTLLEKIIRAGLICSGFSSSPPYLLRSGAGFGGSEVSLCCFPVLIRNTFYFSCLGCKYNQVNSHFHCIREGCMFSFLLKHQMTSHARKHMRRMLGKNFDRVPSQVCYVYQHLIP